MRVRGRDAAAFLQAQLTQDILALDSGHAGLAAWLDPKGRVLVTLEVVPDRDSWLLLVPADAAASVLARLERYVLRADVALGLDDTTKVYALIGDAAEWLDEHGIELGDAPRSLRRHGDVVWIREASRLVRAVAPQKALEAAFVRLESASADEIALAEIGLGWPSIGAALAERYVPHMLNLERLGAVAFDKGCYPGQEVVARVHNRGAVKRRAARFRVGGPAPAVGEALADAEGAEAGEVVRAAQSGGTAELLAVVRLEALAGPLFVAGADGQRELERLALPFEHPGDS